MISVFAYLNNNHFLKSMFAAETTSHTFCKSQIEYLPVAFDSLGCVGVSCFPEVLFIDGS